MVDLKKEIVKKKIGASFNCQITFEQRKIIERLLKEGKSQKEIAKKVNISRSTLYYERMRCSHLNEYDAKVAHQNMLNKRSIQTKPKSHTPRVYKESVNKIYKNIKTLLEKKLHHSVREILLECQALCIKAGAQTDLMKFPMTIEEHKKAIELYQQYGSIKKVALLMNRSYSTIAKIIKNYKEQEEVNIEEICYGKLSEKWLN